MNPPAVVTVSYCPTSVCSIFNRHKQGDSLFTALSKHFYSKGVNPDFPITVTKGQSPHPDNPFCFLSSESLKSDDKACSKQRDYHF